MMLCCQALFISSTTKLHSVYRSLALPLFIWQACMSSVDPICLAFIACMQEVGEQARGSQDHLRAAHKRDWLSRRKPDPNSFATSSLKACTAPLPGSIVAGNLLIVPNLFPQKFVHEVQQTLLFDLQRRRSITIAIWSVILYVVFLSWHHYFVP
jgi:hypothetical protein